MVICPQCGQENPEGARFCNACGAPLATPAPQRRKLATLLFCDMSGSTAMGERVDAESVREMMFSYFHQMRDAIERHGGTVEKFVGDAVMAVFGVPTAHEDDALRAVRAAREMQERLGGLNEELERRYGNRIALRIGLNTGEVVAGGATSRETIVTGDAVNVAARLEQAAKPGEILLGELTHQLVRDAVSVEPVEPLALKGKSEPMPAYRLLEADAAAAPSRRVDAPLVGRKAELRILEDTFRAAVTSRSCQLVTVIGEAGVGKSRLAAELLDRAAGEATILRGRCLSYGEGITFWAIGEIVRQAAGIRDDHSRHEAQDRIASLVAGEPQGELLALAVAQAIGLAEGAAAAEEIAWAIRELLQALARERPLLLVVDDIHWAEPALLDLLASMPARSREAPILCLCLARPEVLDVRAEWEPIVRLEPLTGSQTEELLGHLLGASEGGEARASLARAAAGNPFFAEELVAFLTEHESAERLPPTLGALLGARLDSLGEERSTLERGAVEGEVFHRGGVFALTPGEAVPRIPDHLDALARKDFLRPAQATFADEAAFRFRHLLLRDAAYNGTAKKLRAELHERFAAWLEGMAGERIAEYEEILGHHLERAYRFRAELGPVDADGEALAARAGENLASAGRRAFDRDDTSAAVKLLERAAALLRPEDPRRLEVLLDLGSGLADAGELDRPNDLFSEVARLAGSAGDHRLEAHALLEREGLRLHVDPNARADDLLSLVERALPVFEVAGDLARAWLLMGETHVYALRWSRATEAWERALDHARRAGSPRDEGDALSWLVSALLSGPTPVDEAIPRTEALLEQAQTIRGRLNTSLAQLYAMQGRFEEARERCSLYQTTLQSLGATLWAAVGALRAGPIEMLAGDPRAAERKLRHGYEALGAMGEKGHFSTVAALLAEAVYEQGRYDEAERLTEESEEAASPDDVISHVIARSTRAKVLARRGEFEAGERLAREAFRLIEETEEVDQHAGTLMSLAEVILLAGRANEAAPYVQEALNLYEQKGNVVSAQKARELVAELAAV